MVRPIDLQDNLSKAPLASRAQHVQQSAPEMAHRHAAQTAAQQQVVDLSRSLPAEAGDRAEFHRDDSADGGARRHGRQRPGTEPQPEPPDAPASADPAHIDIVA
jgi:hypothetical protein